VIQRVEGLHYLVQMRSAAQRWFKFRNEGPDPHRRSCHAMASDGTRIFLLGGWPKGAQADEISLIHVLDTSMYIRLVISSGQPPRLRTQNTSNTRKPTLTPSVPIRRKPPNLRGSHLQVPRPRSSHRTRYPPPRRPTVLSLFEEPPPLYWAALPLRRLLTKAMSVKVQSGTMRSLRRLILLLKETLQA
jgi:hypothetical protein